MKYDKWLQTGLDNGWCGPAVCYTHDGLPETPAEEEMWMNGQDPCVYIIRLYEDDIMRQEIEANHSPSVWRKPYTK